MDVEKIWVNVLQEIKLQVSDGIFFGLFKLTSLLSVDNHIATIAAPNAMIIDLLQKRFIPLIKSCLEKQIKTDVDIFFIPKVIHTKKNPKEADEGPLFTKKEQSLPAPIGKSIGHVPRVRSDFTFQTLAVSESNRLAYASAQTVAEKLGTAYNPLFLYGPVGVGKTHLMQAIANDVYLKNPDIKIIYITSEEFTNEVVEAIRNNDTAKMKKRFRSANLLMIDDVQFIAGKDKVQEELFHTFNTLIDSRGQIVLSSDKPPSEIKKLESRLSSRFAGGLTVDIEPPDFEMRTAIILKKAEQLHVALSIDTAKTIAEKQQDTRSLEGALMLAKTTAEATHQELTPELAELAMKNGKQERLAFHSEDIIQGACFHFNIKITQLKGPKRNASLVRARQITMYLLRTEANLTHVEIGNVLGGRDHTTVMHGVTKVENLLKTNPGFNEEIVGIMKNIRG